MEENKLYEMEYVNGELVIPELLDTDGNPIVVSVEEEEENNNADKAILAAGAAVIGIAATIYLARKPIKKLFKATKKAYGEFKSELSKPDGVDTDGDEPEIIDATDVE